MESADSKHGGSPYITNVDVVPPSPPRSLHTFDTHPFNDTLTSPPPFAHTPSYNGSYYNSPYSQHSQLSFTGDDLDLPYDILDLSGMNDYEPSEYDPVAPQQEPQGSLLMFAGVEQGEYGAMDVLSPDFASPDAHRTHGSPFDHSSPSSTGGDEHQPSNNTNNTSSGFYDQDNGATGRHSRASSVASAHHSPHPPHMSLSPSPSPQPYNNNNNGLQPHNSNNGGQSHSGHPSPRLDVAQSFGNISIHTPNWGTQPLPSSSPNPHHAPLPAHKAQSPPRLLMPDNLDEQQSYGAQQQQQSQQQQQQQNPYGGTNNNNSNDTSMLTAIPKINAPDDDMEGIGMGGPQFHLVPATPVSGGPDGRQPFQQTLATLTQGAELNTGSSPGSPNLQHQQHQDELYNRSHSQPPSRGHSPYPPSQGSAPHSRPPSTNPPQSQGQGPSRGHSPAHGHGHTSASSTGGFVFPENQTLVPPPQQSPPLGPPVQERGRRTSAGAADISASWGGAGLGGAGAYQQPGFTSAYAQQQAQVQAQQQAQQAAQQQAQQQQQQHRQNLQSFQFGGVGNAGGSLTAPMRGGHRMTRSDGGSGLVLGPGGGPNNNVGYAPHHGQSSSISGLGHVYGDAYQPQPPGGGFLHPMHVPSHSQSSIGSGSGLPPLGGRSLSPGTGHFRRASASSGGRSDRGAELWSGAGGGGVHLSAGRRVSPYPSPNASPRVRYTDLEEDEGDLGPNGGLSGLGLGMGGMGMGMGGGGMGGGGGGGFGMGGHGLSIGISNTSLGGGGLGGGDIGEPPVSAGYSEEVAITGRRAYSHSRAGDRDDLSSNGGHDGGRRRAGSSTSIGDAGSAVAKQNVTTGRTANASIRRRKQDANFACTIPGCNSTFTRGFNLKGHLRSHFEQKPYKCHWPGCGKGFARQHDCKRHEQLHSNFRPFECEGCKKQFARMDALNRHLRSEAGAECAKTVEANRAAGIGGDGTVGGGVDVRMDGEEEEEEEEKVGLLSQYPMPVPQQQQQGQGRPPPRRRGTGGSGGMMAEEWASVAV